MENMVFEKTFNTVINGDYCSLYGSCVTEKNDSEYVNNITLLANYICSYFDLMGANQSNVKGIRKISRNRIGVILERLYNCSTYNCTNTPAFSAMLEVALEMKDLKAINKLNAIVEAYKKQAILQPKFISILRDYYNREWI